MSYLGLTRNGIANESCATCKYSVKVSGTLTCKNTANKLYACSVGSNVWCGNWQKEEQAYKNAKKKRGC